MDTATPRYLPAGESALLVEFGATIDPALNEKVLALDAALAAEPIAGVVEIVPTYRSLLIHFDPRAVSTADLIALIERRDATPPLVEQPGATSGAAWIVPVCYEMAEDIAEISAALGLTPAEIVALHAGATYRVYMYGFAPGYVFLGGLPAQLGISRRASPRPPVPQGSLLIAGGQALIGHDPMPTGWYHIGVTPYASFDANRTPPCVIEVGDTVRFEAVDRTEFARLEEAARSGATIARLSSPAA